MGSLRDREVACSASDRQGSNFESCVWRTVSSQSSHQPQEVLLAQFSLYVHKGGLKPDSFNFFLIAKVRNYGIPLFYRKWRYMVAAILNLKKCTRGIFGTSSEFVWGDVHVSFLKKSAFFNFIPGSTLMLLHYIASFTLSTIPIPKMSHVGFIF